jgi:predicted phage baseplate assembly protein
VGPAAAAFEWELENVRPAIWLGDDRGGFWQARHDLLSSDSFAPEFVVETEDNGRATVRFGDDENGMRPGEGSRFSAVYRVGNGRRGNIGAESLTHVTDGALQTDAQWIDSVSNPIPARGGVDPETLEQVRQYAPAAFRVPKRAVTPEDYATMAEKHPEVQNATATLRWAASWHTVFLTVDRVGGRGVDDAFEEELRRHLEPYRMAGHDLEIDGPHFVALEVEMLVCVAPNYFRGDVLAELRAVFGSGTSANGTRGFFHPDNFSFGQGVYLSQLYAAAQKVAGVRHVEILTLQRSTQPSAAALDEAVLTMGRLEIARLDNNPNFPDRGVLKFTMRGGR